MDTPRVNAVGIVEYPEDYEASPRRYGRTLRLFAWFFLGFFALATFVTSALSLGAYCLTSDGGDVRAIVESPLLQERAAP